MCCPPRAAAAATAADHRPTRRRRAPPGRGGAARAGGAWRSTGHRGDGGSGRRGGRGGRCRRGRGRRLRVLEGLAEGAAALAPTAGEVAGAMAAMAGVGAAATAGFGRGTRSLRPGPRHGLGAGEHALPASQGSEDAAVQDVRSANNMNDATQPQHFTLRSGSSTSGSPASSRAFSHSGFRVQAQTNQRRAPSPGPEPCDSAPVPAELPGKLPQLRTPEPPASAELRPAGPRHRGGQTRENECCATCKEAWR